MGAEVDAQKQAAEFAESSEARGLAQASGVRRPVVVLAEDNDDARRVYGLVLRHFGYQVEEASTGHEAVRLARPVRPNLVLMDIGCPDWTGGKRVGFSNPTRSPVAFHSSPSPRTSIRPPTSADDRRSTGTSSSRSARPIWSRASTPISDDRVRSPSVVDDDAHTASDKLVKLKSRTLSAGITTSPPASVPATRTGPPDSPRGCSA